MREHITLGIEYILKHAQYRNQATSGTEYARNEEMYNESDYSVNQVR